MVELHARDGEAIDVATFLVLTDESVRVPVVIRLLKKTQQKIVI